MISVIGSSGIDHVLIPYKNEWKNREQQAGTQRVFLDWPELSYIASFRLPAGAIFLQRLLESIESTVSPATSTQLVSGNKEVTEGYFKEQLPSFPTYWETFSSWDSAIAEKSGSGSQGEIAYAKPRNYYGRSGPSAECCSNNDEKSTWKLISGITPYDIQNSTVLSIYDEVSISLKIPQEIDSFKEDSKAIIRTRLCYNPRIKAHFEEPEIVKELVGKGFKVENMVLLLNDDELRRGGGLLGAPSCWENVFYYLKKIIEAFGSTEEYSADKYLAVVIGLSTHGALVFQGAKGEEPETYTLFYYEDEIGDLSSSTVKGLQGRSFGAMTVLQAALSFALHDNRNSARTALRQGVMAGLYANKQFSETGHILSVRHDEKYPLIFPERISYPFEDVAATIVDVLKTKEEREKVDIKDRHFPSSIDIDHNWFKPSETPINNEKSFVDSILKVILSDEDNTLTELFGEPIPLEEKSPTASTSDIANNAPEIIHNGKLPSNSRMFVFCKQIIQYGRINQIIRGDFWKSNPPYLRLGGFLTYDRNEMYQVCNTYNAMKHYMRDHHQRNPLSLCVFGQPGSGKSFAVKEIVKSLDEKRKGDQLPCELLTFNLSQMKTIKDLVQAFHQVRDSGLNGKMPIVFFDEFDSEFEGIPLGWLRFFLSPMQDGEFFYEGVRHKLGRSILVFAGGTCNTMDEFKQQKGLLGENGTQTSLKSAKLPDFISRLRGYIDVAGPDSTKTGEKPGILHYIRRACLIRTLLEKQFGVRKNGYIGVNDDVIYALMNVRKYTNGTRSLQSVLQMGLSENNQNFSAAQVFSDGNGILLHLEGSDPIGDFADDLRNVL